MANRVEYLSDRMVSIRGRIKDRQAAHGLIPEENDTPDAASESAPVVAENMPPASEAATPKAARQTALERRLQEALQLRDDLLQRFHHSLGTAEALARRCRAESEAADRTLQQLVAFSEREDMRQLTEFCGLSDSPENETLPEFSTVGAFYRETDRLRLEFFQLSGQLESLRAVADPGTNGATMAKSTTSATERLDFLSIGFGQWFRLGFALFLPLIGGILLGAALSSLILYFAWR